MSNLHKIFVNLPVKDLPSTMAFFKALGYSFNPQFTDENAACLVLGDDIFVMLLAEPFFKTFIARDIADTSRVAEMILSLSVDSRQAVDDLVSKALAAGGYPSKPANDLGFMYSWSFLDRDGHHWEVFYMDPAHLQQ
jgi:uncharacterized protein